MENTFLARPHCFISTGNEWPKDIMFFSAKRWANTKNPQTLNVP